MVCITIYVVQQATAIHESKQVFGGF